MYTEDVTVSAAGQLVRGGWSPAAAETSRLIKKINAR